jgi:hypothetical protein
LRIVLVVDHGDRPTGLTDRTLTWQYRYPVSDRKFV